MKDITFITSFMSIPILLNPMWAERIKIVEAAKNIVLMREIEHLDFPRWQAVFSITWIGFLMGSNIAKHEIHPKMLALLLGQCISWAVVFLFFAISCAQVRSEYLFRMSAAAWMCPGVFIAVFFQPAGFLVFSVESAFFSTAFLFWYFFLVAKKILSAAGVCRILSRKGVKQKKTNASGQDGADLRIHWLRQF